MNASDIIERLGGTAAVARLCEVKPPSVSEWKQSGIPRAREQYLRLLKPEAFLPAGDTETSTPSQTA